MSMENSYQRHYVETLDLGADPFDTSEKSRFFFQAGDRQRSLDQLIHYARFSQQATLLCSELGSGKAQLIDQLIEVLQPIMPYGRLQVDSLNGTDEILRGIAEALSISVDEKPTVASIITFLQHTLKAVDDSEPVLLVIENVHYLTREEIELLLLLHREGRGLLHLLMVSETMTAVLEVMAGHGAEGVQVIKLRPLTLEETKDYLLACLVSVGYAGDMPLNSQQLEGLHQKAQGNFLRIRQQAALLLMPETKASASPRFTMPITHIVAVSVLVAGLIVASLYNSDDEVVAVTDGSVEVPVALVLQEPDPELELVNSQPLVEPVEAAPEDERPKVTAPEIKEPLSPLPLLTLEEDGEKSIELPKHSELVNTKLDAPDTPVIEKPSLAIAAKPVIKPVYSSSERRVLAMKSSHMLLQLLGTRSEQSAKQFVQQHSRSGSMFYLPLSLKGDPWYIVLMGDYPSRDAAILARNALPAVLQRQKPWLRSVEGVQAEIQKNSP